MVVEQANPGEGAERDWRRLAEERARALAESEARRADAEEERALWKRTAEARAEAAGRAERHERAWRKTAQTAEEWADQLGRVRLWLQEQLLVKNQELQDARRQAEQAAAERSVWQERCQAALAALAQKSEELERVGRLLGALERSRGVRLLRWVRRTLQVPRALRGTLALRPARAGR